MNPPARDAMNLPPGGPSRPPRLPDIGEPDEFEPDSLPVEPDEGPVPPFIPDDPEHERLVDPEMRPMPGLDSATSDRQVPAARGAR